MWGFTKETEVVLRCCNCLLDEESGVMVRKNGYGGVKVEEGVKRSSEGS